MPFWSGWKLRERLENESLVIPFHEASIDCAAYTLALGEYAFTTSDAKDRSAAEKTGETPGHRKLAKKDTISIRPGQFAFLLTEEKVTIPDDALGFISVKASRKLDGLINVSGFHVDPGWSSQLIFGVFNAGPQDIVLARGEPLFLLFLADLSPMPDDASAEDRKKYLYPEKDRYDQIPAAMMQRMSGPVPSLFKVDKTIKEMELKLGQLESKLVVATGSAALAIAMVLAIFAKTMFFPSSTPTTRPTEASDTATVLEKPGSPSQPGQMAVPTGAAIPSNQLQTQKPAKTTEDTQQNIRQETQQKEEQRR